jgi:hypothetical protein
MRTAVFKVTCSGHNTFYTSTVIEVKNCSLFDEFLCKLGFFGTSGPV